MILLITGIIIFSIAGIIITYSESKLTENLSFFMFTVGLAFIIIATGIIINTKSKPKYLDLPEEISCAKSGDTLCIFTDNNNIEIEFYNNSISQQNSEIVILK